MKIRNRMRIEKNRIEAFSDGVMAIIVTIMMLNIPCPAVTAEKVSQRFCLTSPSFLSALL